MPTMVDYLAWTFSTAISFTRGGVIEHRYNNVATIPAFGEAGLGLLPVLAYNLAYRAQSATEPPDWWFRFHPQVRVGGTTLVNDCEQGWFPFGGAGGFQGMKFGFIRQAALQNGAAIDLVYQLTVQSPATWVDQVESVVTFALFRDLYGRSNLPPNATWDERVLEAGEESSDTGGDISTPFAIGWTVGAPPLFDPAPCESITYYAWDTGTSTAAVSVTSETHTGWEDAIVALDGPRASLIGLYMPTSPPQLTGTVTGAPTGAGNHQNLWYAVYSQAAPVPAVATPARLATIVG